MDTPVIKPGYQVCCFSFIAEFIVTRQMKDGEAKEEKEVNRGYWRELEPENWQYWHLFMVKLVREFEMWHKLGMWKPARIEWYFQRFYTGVKRIQITGTDH